MIWSRRCLLQSCGRSRRRRRGMGTVPTATVRGARRSPCKVSRVFSLSWVLRAASWIRRRSRAGAYCSCLQEGSRPRLVSRSVIVKLPEPARKLSARSTDSGTEHSLGAGASAGQCAAAAAGECVFGSVFADMACGVPHAPPLLWPCLLMPMVKGMAAGHQQALAAQAEQWRIRGR